MSPRVTPFALLAALLPAALGTAAPLRVVATHPALASIVEQVGGARVTVTSITPPGQDVHSIEAKPSTFTLLADAAVLVHSGLDLELWLEPAIQGSRNPRIRRGEPGNVDASAGIHLLDVPANPTRAAGDVHLYGNPHFWMDPLNGRTMAGTIAAGLTAADPAGVEDYLAGKQAFAADLDRRLRGWLRAAIPRKNTPLVVYHDSFPYFVRRFGFRVVATVERKPRIPPTQGHLLDVLRTMEEQDVRVIVREPFHDRAATDFLAERTGARVVTLSTSPGVPAAAATYQDMIEHDLHAILDALP